MDMTNPFALLPPRASHPEPATAPIGKAARLRHLLLNNRLEFLMEAHNGLSARIVEEAGFAGIWGSGLSLSASLGVRDNNEASWTQVLEMLEFMSDATTIPILMDGDTGYGNFNNMRRLVKKLEQRQIAGVCIEDKVFPKTNSFLRDCRQPLADIDEFAGKIKAGKDSQMDDDFVIVARVEALIAGWGMDEALRRAEAYHAAGADAILIHSKRSSPDEIFLFLDEWANRCPVVLVPTKYYTTPTEAFRQKKVSLVIWANHLLRGSIQKMQEVARRIHDDQHLLDVEDQIASLGEVFRLQRDDELQEAEGRYLREGHNHHRAVILAASRGEGSLGQLTEERPKAMLPVGKFSILEHAVHALRQHGVEDIDVVAGYRRDAIHLPGVTVIDNPAYAETAALASLARAAVQLQGNCLLLFGDVLFKPYILQMLVDDGSDAVLIADRHSPRHRRSEYVKVASHIGKLPVFPDFHLTGSEWAASPEGFDGEWIGLAKFSERGAALARTALEGLAGDPQFPSMHLSHLFNAMLALGADIRVHYVAGHWIDVDTLADLGEAHQFLARV